MPGLVELSALLACVFEAKKKNQSSFKDERKIIIPIFGWTTNIIIIKISDKFFPIFSCNSHMFCQYLW